MDCAAADGVDGADVSAVPPDHPPPEASEFARMLEESNAKCEAALALVDALESALTRNTGHLSGQDQATLFHARAFLEAFGVRKPAKRVEWIDRG